tara:strand:+ start:248 stop:1006 length:759 start_codon:yes stop_codon:yes gene_type:complete
MYNTTGKCHFVGIANEKELCAKMQDNRVLAEKIIGIRLVGDYAVEHRGGTQNKADALLHTPNASVGISYKRKKSLSEGSFDYLNSSSAYKKYISGQHLGEACDSLRGSPVEVEAARTILKSAASRDLDELTSISVRRLLEDHVATPYASLVTAVTDSSTGTLYAYNFGDTPLARHLRRNSKITIVGNAASSRRILFDNEDIGIRLRIVTNNGVTALLGRNKRNKTSIPVVKVQQDRVDRLISEVVNLREVTV